MNDTSASGVEDVDVGQIRGVLRAYLQAHPAATVDVRRRGKVSIGVRIVDPDFRGLNRVEREPEIWRILEALPEDAFTSIYFLLLLTPDELKTSLANMEFEYPASTIAGD